MKIFVSVIKAFTANNEGGNPAGVVLESSHLTEKQMQTIATKMDMSEVAFVSKNSVGEYVVRFFTPTTEVDLCGHATIAAWSLLHRNGLLPGKYAQQTKAGKLEIEIEENGFVFMQQAEANFEETVTKVDACVALGIQKEDLDSDLEPQIVSTGLQSINVALSNKATLLGIKPTTTVMAKVSNKYKCVGGFHVFSLLEGDSKSIAAARNFAPELGIFEESATGTANGALLCYLKRKGVIKGDKLYRIEQGESLGQLSYIYGKFVNESVWVGGTSNFIEVREIDIDSTSG